jgi:hypothetical protein
MLSQFNLKLIFAYEKVKMYNKNSLKMSAKGCVTLASNSGQKCFCKKPLFA